MPIGSYLHQLFNAPPCPSALQTWRWKDRPLPWPRCQSHNVAPWGTSPYPPGLQRDRAQDKTCQRTFHDLTGTLLDGSQRPVRHWRLATLLRCLSWSSRRRARELGLQVRTGYRWWGVCNAARSDERGRQLEGTVEADALCHTAAHPGPAKTGGQQSRDRQPRRPRTRPAAIGASQAMSMTRCTPRRQTCVGRCMGIGRRASCRCGSPLCECFEALAPRICRGRSGAFDACATFTR